MVLSKCMRAGLIFLLDYIGVLWNTDTRSFTNAFIHASTTKRPKRPKKYAVSLGL